MPEVSESHGCSRVDAENADTWKRGNTAHEETVKMLGANQSYDHCNIVYKQYKLVWL